MKVFDDFNNLWHHYNTFDYFFNILCWRLMLNSCIIVLNYLSLAWNFECFNFSFIDDNLSENFFRNLFFNKDFCFIYDFFDYFLYNLNLSLMMNFFLNFLDLIDKCTDWNISVGLNFNRNLFVVNVMFWSVDLNKVRLFDEFWHMNREGSFMIFVHDFVHIKINLFGNLDCVLDLNNFLS